ncbi:MAG: bifunctional UDP-N-acetylglucosamine diphosphorylase/glucosamine-1-phosphate N-acetyltransferase GlmU [Candidatus Nanopelagicales bacterium]
MSQPGTSHDPSVQTVQAVIILAAGEGKRMKSARPKVLHEIGGRSLVGHAVAAAETVAAETVCVVVGHGREQVVAHLAAVAPQVRTALQAEQLGTGHAVQCALRELPPINAGTVLVTYGDVPLLTGQTLRELVARHDAQSNAMTVLTANVADPTGYGRIVRAADGGVAAIVEDRDASPEQLRITEVNSGIYAFDAETLTSALSQLSPENDQGELYLTDVLAIARAQGKRVAAFVIDDVWQTEGVNDRGQLAQLRRELNNRVLAGWMRAGVSIFDPATTWIDDTVRLAADSEVLPGTFLRGATVIATGAVVGPDTTLTGCQVGEGAQVRRSEATGVSIPVGARVGPFAVLAPPNPT